MAESNPSAPPEERQPYQQILINEIEEGLDELRRPPTGLFLSGLSAGLDIGFSVLLIAVVISSLAPHLSEATALLLQANAYSFGFLLVVLGRSELFTEHTAQAMFPVLAGRSSLKAMFRLWGIVYLSNIIGGTIFALLATSIGPKLGVVSSDAFAEIAHHVVDYDWWVVLLSAVLAGWLMGLLSWIVSASKQMISRAFVVWLITSAIGLLGLHHCIVGTVELAAGLLVEGGIGWSAAATTQTMATAGNVIGGVIFVALVKYSHASRSVDPDERAEEETTLE